MIKYCIPWSSQGKVANSHRYKINMSSFCKELLKVFCHSRQLDLGNDQAYFSYLQSDKVTLFAVFKRVLVVRNIIIIIGVYIYQ